MRRALHQAEIALARQEVPIGCVFVLDNTVIGVGSNMTNTTRNATRHAELEAIDQLLAASGNTVDWSRCTLYVTCEPCIMCAGALASLGIGHVYYGCQNDRFGGCGSILSLHEKGCGTCGRECKRSRFACSGGLLAAEAINLLRQFYASGNPNAPMPHRPVMEKNWPLSIVKSVH
ncbi:hypothetical protein WJX77_005392 [Trebouxia sp. C0004]